MSGTVSRARAQPGGTNVSYPYSQGDLLAEKPVYNFSVFRGASFLNAYEAARKDWLAALAPAAEAAAPARRGLAAFLQAAIDEPPEADRAAFMLLVQRFEVTKRLWPDVDDRFRPTRAAAPGDAGLYALFALAALRLHSCSPHLSLLNAALKAHDIVTSQNPARVAPDLAAIAREGLALELEIVSALVRQAGASI